MLLQDLAGKPFYKLFSLKSFYFLESKEWLPVMLSTWTAACVCGNNNYRRCKWSWPNCSLFQSALRNSNQPLNVDMSCSAFPNEFKHTVLSFSSLAVSLFWRYFSFSRAPCCSNYFGFKLYSICDLNASQLSCHYSALYCILPLGCNCLKCSLAKKMRWNALCFKCWCN